jgi:hypothetical protein
VRGIEEKPEYLMLYLTLSILIAGVLFALMYGLLLWALAAYLAAGLVYYLIMRRRPVSQWPSAMYSLGGMVYLLLVWPYTFYSFAYVDYFMVRPVRFKIYYGNQTDGLSLGENRNSFASWEEAVAFARKQARESSEQVDIFDGLRYEKSWGGGYCEIMYHVAPSGDVYRAHPGRLPTKVL